MLWRPLARAASASRPFYRRSARAAAAPFSSASRDRRVLCVDVADAACVQELVQRGHRVDQLHEPSDEQLLEVIGDYDALLVAPTTSVPTELLARGAAAKLELIAVPCDAIDSTRIDTTEATARGVLLLQLDKKQVGDKFSVEAETALTLLLQLARRIPASIDAARAVSLSSRTDPLSREAFAGTELFNKSLGIVGLGQAGKCVVEMARALGLQVFGYDPNLTHEAASLMGVKRVSLDELYAQSDFLSFHAPLTGRTRGMFDAHALAKCKPGVTIVSVAEYKGRDGLLDLATLVDGLESGRIAGVGMDFFEDGQDESAAWQKLVAHDRVLTTRHVDAPSSALAKAVADTKKYRAIAENVSDALAKRYYRGVANGVFMPLTLTPEMQPFLQLSESLGRFLFDLVVTNDPKDPITKVTLAATGGVQVDITATKAKSALQSAVLKGIIDCIHAKRRADATRVTLLNASMVAMHLGMDARVGDLATRESTTHLNNSITVQVETKSHQQFLVMGSVFGEDPRIVRINEYTDFPAFRPEGNLLLFKNEDKPGAIAGILQVLADAKINIANFGLSRHANVDLALGILALDAPVTPETMAKLKQLPTVENVQFAQV